MTLMKILDNAQRIANDFDDLIILILMNVTVKMKVMILIWSSQIW